MVVRFCLRLLCIFFVVGAVIVGVPARVNAGPISIVSGSGANPAAIKRLSTNSDWTWATRTTATPPARRMRAAER